MSEAGSATEPSYTLDERRTNHRDRILSLTEKPTHANDSAPYVVGIDLGATNIKLGILKHGDVLVRNQIRTADFAQPADAFLRVREFAEQAIHDQGDRPSSLRSVGLAMPGVIDDAGAVLVETANLHAWKGISFHAELARVFQRPVAVINDANAAALGEARFGRHRTSSLALLTIGTGIGGGLIVDGRAIGGAHGCGGEIGHVTIDHSSSARVCGCGKPGHLEAYAGAAGIVKTAMEFLRVPRQSSRLHDAENLTPRLIAQAAESGDVIASQAVEQTALYLGRAIAMLAHLTDPSVVLLGGAINFGAGETVTGRRFLQTIRAEVARRSLVQAGTQVTIDFASLGNDAGMLGAAQHAMDV